MPQSNATLNSNPVSLPLQGTWTGFSLQAVPPIVFVAQTGSYAVFIPITYLGGFFGPVTFTYFGAPVGMTVSFAPNPSTTTVMMVITVAPTVPVGKYTITVQGASGPDIEFVFAHTVVVTPGSAPSTDFLLQEDGVSLFELEDGSGFILLEV